MADRRVTEAAELMECFAVRTGLTDQDAARRYLWTDAFALCNFIALRRHTGDARYEALANKLVERVHDVLAPHRDPEHPTAAGLRIGKPLPEREPDEPLDDELEWERDGQYFHYLTKWMHALDELARETDRPKLNLWARELAVTAHRAFTYAKGARHRMYWKMSVDLTRPLVASMGQHDPLDGFITVLALQASPATTLRGADLGDALGDFAAMIDLRELATADPLGIGGLLVDASRLSRLLGMRVRGIDRGLLDAIIEAAALGLDHISRRQDLRAPAGRRLGFRELGLAIGLAAVKHLDDPRLAPYLGLRDRIETFWRDPGNQCAATWTDHQDISDVMLATTLVPDGFLGRSPAA